MEKVKVGVVGVGHMGGYHVVAYTELLDAELVGVADVRVEQAEALAETYGTAAFEELQRAIRQGRGGQHLCPDGVAL